MDVNSFVLGMKAGKTPSQEKEITVNGNGTTEVTPDEGKLLSKVTVNTNVEPRLNIAYGDTPPEDTSKLWVKSSEPEGVAISSTLEPGGFLSKLEDQMSVTLSDRSAARVGTKIYVFGGFAYGTRYNLIEVFDTEYGTVSTSEHVLPNAANSMGIAVVGAKIYLLGGMSSKQLNTIVVFDTENNRLDTLSQTLSDYTIGMAAAAVGTKIYLFGGYNGSNYTNVVRVFDTENNEVKTLTSVFPGTRNGMASAVVGDVVYLFGGYPSGTEIWIYNTATDSLRMIDTVALPQTADDIAAEAIGTRVYLFGGFNRSTAERLDTIHVFDTEDNSIKTLNTVLPIGASSIAYAVANKKVYLFGGHLASGYSKDILEFEPGFELAEKKLAIWTDGNNNVFSLIPNTTICVDKVFVGNERNISTELEAFLYKDGEWQSI